MNFVNAVTRPGLVIGLLLSSLYGIASPLAVGLPSDLAPLAPSLLLAPPVGEHGLRALTPTLLELRLITTHAAPPVGVDLWDFVDPTGRCLTPPPDSFNVIADGQTISVLCVGFKRRVISAALLTSDMRVENSLYLQLARPLTENQSVVVTDDSGLLKHSGESFAVTLNPLRYSPVIHVNQEGYAPNSPKKARIGYYLGNLGELSTVDLSRFTVLNNATGEVAYHGLMTKHSDVGYPDIPPPYQQVLQADFSELNQPGEYTIVIPGLGASFPFSIDAGLAMKWLRTYALGLYHQRCGQTNELPFTRFIHDSCHNGSAEIPVPQTSFDFTWTTIASKSSPSQAQTAPQLVDEASQLYPFVNHGKIDVTGGHHDAGDYSKYTINVAALVHQLMFIADAVPVAGSLDNLGLPESGDGVGDILQEAKIEADLLAKLQDADGGFYFLVYPKNREYEADVSLTIGNTGDPQVVWPKNTAATAAGIAALAQCSSSPAFKNQYPESAARYMYQARLGWSFLQNAIAQHGLEGAYQKITFYGDEFTHNDELAWAATEMYLATGEAVYQKQLFAWFPNPADPSTRRWGWLHLSASYGNAIRSYAFAKRTGRLTDEQFDRIHLAQCRTEISAAADDALRWTRQHAYGSAFPEPVKRFHAAGWYFSLDQAADIAVAYQLWPRAEYLDAIVSNLNYEGGTNPLNLCFLSGLGRKRPQVYVHQFANNDHRTLPPTGLPLGNIQAGFEWLPLYGREPAALTFPSDEAPVSPYPFYDRYADMWNTSTEFITVNQARSLLAVSALLDPTATPSAAWRAGSAQIIEPKIPVLVGTKFPLVVLVDNMDLNQATIIWEGRDQAPAFGLTYVVTPKNAGAQWVEVEITWPDGRRVFASKLFTCIDSPSTQASHLGLIPSRSPHPTTVGTKRKLLSEN